MIGRLTWKNVYSYEAACNELDNLQQQASERTATGNANTYISCSSMRNLDFLMLDLIECGNLISLSRS